MIGTRGERTRIIRRTVRAHARTHTSHASMIARMHESMRDVRFRLAGTPFYLQTKAQCGCNIHWPCSRLSRPSFLR